MNDNLNDNQTVNNENTIVNNQEFEQIEQKPLKKNNNTMKIVIIMAVII